MPQPSEGKPYAMYLDNWIRSLPKVDLHVHLEGTVEPETLLYLAEKNKVTIPWKTVDEVQRAYAFKNLADFLHIYYQCTRVLKSPEDFYYITLQYIRRSAAENTFHSDVFIDPQTHRDKGITLEAMMDGITAALREGARQWDYSMGFILCFLRHRPQREALEILHNLGPTKKHFSAIGLAAKELGYPPHLFTDLYTTAHAMGLYCTAHAGEEGPAEYVRSALFDLKVHRIDHGNAIINDPQLVDYVRAHSIPLTMCPLSNRALHIVDDLSQHPATALLHDDVRVTINSDDPAFFGGYMTENLVAMIKHGQWTIDHIAKVLRHAIDHALMPLHRKKSLRNRFTQALKNTKAK